MSDGFRRVLRRCLGRMPERCALRPSVAERVAVPGGVREKVSYAVERGERVHAYVFVPETPGPHPAVLCVHQHHRQFHLGKSEPAGLAGDPEQFYALEVTARGYVTLAPDAIGFEERQHPMLQGQDYERFEANRRLTEGSCLQAKMLWDLMRALDYLIGRNEVDPRRIGCLGHSLGGQETLFLCAMDPRVAVGVSSCGFSSYRTLFEGFINHNAAAYVPGLLQHGDLGRVLGLVAPRPFLALAGKDDPIFPLAGVRTTVRAARHTYVKTTDRLRLRVFPGGHGFSAPMREAAYAWLDRWLRPGGS